MMNNRHRFDRNFDRGEGPRNPMDPFAPMPFRPGMEEGALETMPFRPGMEGGFRTLPQRPGFDDGPDFGREPGFHGTWDERREGPHDRRNRCGGRPDFDCDDGPEFEDHGCCHGCGRPGHGCDDGPEFEDRRGFHGHGHGDGPDFDGPGRPGRGPRGGRPPFGGKPPRGGRGPERPEEGLSDRIQGACLAELIELAGRLLHHRPGGDAGRGQALVLSILAGRESLSQRELQQLLGVQPGSLSELVSKLERKGMLTRERAEDRRGNLLRLTDAGRRAVPGADASPEDDLFDALTGEQQRTLADLLRTLLVDWAAKLEAEEQGPERHRGPRGGFMTLEEHRGPERPEKPEQV